MCMSILKQVGLGSMLSLRSFLKLGTSPSIYDRVNLFASSERFCSTL
jgi:hypothetical protein